MQEIPSTYSSRVVEAFVHAHTLHHGQTRKGSKSPYLGHLMAVAATVGDFGGSEDQVIAALLHDAVEDQGGQPTLEGIRDRFGERVADYVAACSDTDTMPKPPWRPRKEAFLARVAQALPEVKLIIAADKLHNVRTLIAGLRQHGPVFWNRFSGRREGALWYHEEMLRALSQDWEHPALLSLSDAVHMLHEVDLALSDAKAEGKCE